jgi:hypothetical protein
VSAVCSILGIGHLEIQDEILLRSASMMVQLRSQLREAENTYPERVSLSDQPLRE